MSEHENNPQQQPPTPDPWAGRGTGGPAPEAPAPGSAGGPAPEGPAFGGPGPEGSPYGGPGPEGSPYGGPGPEGSPYGGPGPEGSAFGGPGPEGSAFGGPGSEGPVPGGPEPGETATWDQLSWGAPPADPGRGSSHRRTGRNILAGFGVLALMTISAVGGGVAGALVYAQSDDGGGGGGETTRVVDAPQLDYTSLASIASDVSPSVVSIQIGRVGGSGVVLSEEGHIITNAHVVAAGAGGSPVVRFSNGDIAQATVVGADERTDIAVIQVEGVAGLTPAGFGASSEVLVGDTVLAMGSPLGFDGSVTQGIISALDRTLEPEEPGTPALSGLLQTDAAINRGNSGGALINLDGDVIGINTAIAVENQQDGFLGVGFAVPSDRATAVAEQLIAGEEVQHAFLGVRVASAEEGGALIGEVSPGSPAEAAGLQEGDIILRLGDRQITDANDLVSAVQSAEVGQSLELEFERDGASQTSDVTLAEAQD